MNGALAGLRVRRVDAVALDLLSLELSGRSGRRVLLLGLSPELRGVGLCERRPGASTRSPFVLQARRHLEGGRVIAVEQPEPARVHVAVERGGERYALEAVLRGARGQARLLDARGETLARLHPQREDDAAPADSPRQEPAPLPDEPELFAHGARMLAALEQLGTARARLSLTRGLRSAERRLERRLAAIEEDRARVEQVDALRRQAGLLLGRLHALDRDAGGPIELLDETVDPPARVTLEVDPRLGPRRQAEAWFAAARRLERGAAIASERARTTRAELERVRALAARAERAETLEELELLATEARTLGVPVPSAAKETSRKQREQRLPYREFVGSFGRSILVGRGAEDNDRLTLDHARPHDLWLHARDDSGAHVVVPLARHEACPPELLADAATLAAHFSRARGEARVDIVYAERRHVRKPRKSPAGLVMVSREKVFHLQLESERLRRLLAAERRARA